MNFLKIKLGLFSLLAILAVSVFLTSCEQESITTTVANDITEETLIKAILDLPEVKDFDENQSGELILDNIGLVYSNTDELGDTKLSLFGIPVKSVKANTIMDLYVFYDHGTKQFDFTIYEVEYDNELYENLLANAHLNIAQMTESELSDIGLAYSAKESLLSIKGEAIIINEYKDNELVNSIDNSALRGFAGWGCMLVCVIDKMSHLNRAACSLPIAACRAAPGWPCVATVFACGLASEPEWNDCYNNHCFIEPLCHGPNWINGNTSGGGTVNLWWDDSADYYWLYHWDIYNTGWVYIGTFGDASATLGATQGDWYFAAEGVCGGSTGQGIRYYKHINVPAYLNSGDTGNEIKIIEKAEVE